MLDAVHARSQRVFAARGEVGSVEKALEQQDRLAETGVAQRHRRLDVKQREAVDDVGDRLRSAQQTVAVGVGLDHCPGFGRVTGDPPLGDEIIVAQHGKVDARFLSDEAWDEMLLGDWLGGSQVSTPFCFSTRLRGFCALTTSKFSWYKSASL